MQFSISSGTARAVAMQYGLVGDEFRITYAPVIAGCEPAPDDFLPIDTCQQGILNTGASPLVFFMPGTYKVEARPTNSARVYIEVGEPFDVELGVTGLDPVCAAIVQPGAV